MSPRDLIERTDWPPGQNGEPPSLGKRLRGSESKSRNWVIGCTENSKAKLRLQRRPKSLRLDVIRPRGSFGTSKDWSAYSDPDRNPQFRRCWSEPDIDDRPHARTANAVTGRHAESIRAEIEAEKARVLRSHQYAQHAGGRP